MLIVGAAEAMVMLPSAFNPEIIGTLDLIFGSGMQVLGSGLTIVALFWGCGYAVASRQIFGAAPTLWQKRFFVVATLDRSHRSRHCTGVVRD